MTLDFFRFFTFAFWEYIPTPVGDIHRSSLIAVVTETKANTPKEDDRNAVKKIDQKEK